MPGTCTRLPAFGRWLRARRALAGLGQVDLADLLDVWQSAVSDWERGRRRPSGDHLEQLADWAGVPVESLRYLVETPDADEDEIARLLAGKEDR